MPRLGCCAFRNLYQLGYIAWLDRHLHLKATAPETVAAACRACHVTRSIWSIFPSMDYKHMFTCHCFEVAQMLTRPPKSGEILENDSGWGQGFCCLANPLGVSLAISHGKPWAMERTHRSYQRHNDHTLSPSSFAVLARCGPTSLATLTTCPPTSFAALARCGPTSFAT